MTQEEEQLLLNDIYARLPYGVNVKIYNFFRDDFQEDTLTIDNASKRIYTFGIPSIKPYLRPMSSMTEEEYNSISWEGCNRTINYSMKNGFQFIEITSFTIEILNWLNEHHFDYRGLIEKGLALVAPEGMYEN